MKINVMSQTSITMLSERTKKYRIDFPLTQKQLAEKSGVSLRCIQTFESGRDIQLGNFIKILRAMDLIDNLEMLVPDVTKRPSAYLDTQKERKRVRMEKKDTEQNTSFKWGDEI